ncbi:single-stranded DNA-binding protein [Klebsiella pneumoniae]|uniref:single-stranded DNA-binding protein n=1 Tax=Klebsiella pneumoniae TaxID=573 RepID=UPI003970B7F7
MARNRLSSDNEGRSKEMEWHDIAACGKKAEAAGKYFKKGMMLYFVGRIYNKWVMTAKCAAIGNCDR